jgi:thiamine pyrophosphate-dependent acetolactate synthase large subunit-like protein
MLTGGEVAVACLAAHGVEVVFGIPGTHNLPLYAQLERHGIRHVLPRHEQGAGYAADGYARASGRPGVAITTAGPALMNAAAAAGQAQSDSVPLLILAPGMPRAHPAASSGYLHEMPSQQRAMSGVVARSVRVMSHAELASELAAAFTAFRTERPRARYVEVPLDLLAEEAEVVVPEPQHAGPPAPAPAALAAAVELLRGAARPAIVAGGGAAGAADALRDVAERIGAPVITTANGKGVLPEDHPLSLGAGVHLPAVRDLVAEADVVLAVGTELAPSDLWWGPLPLDGRLVRIDVDAVGSLVNATPAVALVGDAAATLDALLDALPEAGTPGRAAAERAAPWRARKDEEARAEGAEWLPIVRQLSEALPRDAIVAGDSAMVCYYGALTNLTTARPGSFLYPTGFGTLGYGLPAAIGAKVAAPEAPVVALLGDGGVMFTLAELATAADLAVPLPIVVVDNSGYGEIRNEMIDRDDPVHAVTFRSPDFAAIGRAVGCDGVSLDGPAGLADAVRRALAADRPTVIHLRHDPAAPGEGADR